MTARALLDSRSADKLVKICGLLGSNHDGERASAAAKADALVRSHGLTWADVVSPPMAPSAPRIRTWRAADSNWRIMAEYCRLRYRSLSPKERAFVESVRAWRSEPTERQIDWFTAIYARLHEGGAGR
jgi:hypothetical protein